MSAHRSRCLAFSSAVALMPLKNEFDSGVLTFDCINAAVNHTTHTKADAGLQKIRALQRNFVVATVDKMPGAFAVEGKTLYI
jgi:hypothetical protein